MSHNAFIFSGSRRLGAQRELRRVPFFLLSLLLTVGLKTATLAAEKLSDPNRIIQYRGPMPLLRQELWSREVEFKFELYRSPNGGTPYWTETRRVQVSTNGWVKVDLGQLEPLPDEAFTSPFRFLSIWRDNHEYAPRKQIASLVYVASTYEAGASKENYLELALADANAAAAKAPNRENRLDALVSCGNFSMETHPRFATNWLAAAATARRLGASLPTFEEWYGAYDGKSSGKLVGMAGHYEWVVPWVYEPMIHGRLNELYRGKPVACYYNELNPLNAYPFRLLQRTQAAESKN